MSIGRVAFLTAALSVAPTAAFGQTVPPAAEAPDTPRRTRFQAGIGGLIGAATGEFDTFVDGAGGVLGHVEYGLGRGIFRLGGEFGWMRYGHVTRTVPLAPVIPEVPDATVDVSTSNNLFLVHARVRVQPRQGRWRPYVDGLVGMTNLYTESTVESTECSDSFCADGIRNSTYTHSSDVVLSYGGGAGLQVALSSNERVPRLDIAVRYLNGGSAEYLAKGAVRVEGDNLVRNFTRSTTDMVIMYVGLAFGN